MEQSYSYNPVLSTAHHPLNQAQAHHHQQHSPTQHTQGGMASPRSIQPLPPLISAPQPYGIQSPPQQAHPHSQSQYPRNPSYGNGYEYRPAAETHYTHQPAANLLSMSSPTGVAPQGYASPSQSTGMSMAAHGGAQRQMDTTGQLPPLGMRSRLTTSVFEEEGSLCFQVDVDGICVARREDNHMINGTKLLNVAKMTRGRRDGILKAEKNKNVVKIGPMHLKGVWIPFERALVLANQEKITEQLYPLFVHNIGTLLYHNSVSRPLPPPPPPSSSPYPRSVAVPLPSIQYVEVNDASQISQRD